LSAELPNAERDPDTVAALWKQRDAWERRPLLRALYRDWFRSIVARLSVVEGPTVEIGTGCGAFQDFMPEAIGTDVIPTPWADRVADAQRLPFGADSVANLVLIDVLHHVPRPAAALCDAERVLRPGGRLLMLEPYCVPLSTLGYRWLHHERLDLEIGPDAHSGQSSDDPLDANIAIPTIVFWRPPGS
jgi:SAM-dependent methyltransferase